MKLRQIVPILSLCFACPSMSVFALADAPSDAASESSEAPPKKGPMKFVETTKPKTGTLKLKPAWARGPIGFIDTNSPDAPKTDLGVEQDFERYRSKFVNTPDHVEFLAKKYDLHPSEEQVVRKIYKLQRAEGLTAAQVKADLKAIGTVELGLSLKRSGELAEILLSEKAANLEIPEILHTFSKDLQKLHLAELKDGKTRTPRVDLSAMQGAAEASEVEKKPMGFVENKTATEGTTDLKSEDGFRKFQYKFVAPNGFDRMEYLSKIYDLSLEVETVIREIRELRHSSAPASEVKAELQALGEKAFNLSKREAKTFADAVLNPKNKGYDTVQIFQKFGEALVEARSQVAAAQEASTEKRQVEAPESQTESSEKEKMQERSLNRSIGRARAKVGGGLKVDPKGSVRKAGRR